MSAEPTADNAVPFEFNGRRLNAKEGQTIAAALAASGIWTLTNSVKYRRPRGVYCAGGYCPNCLVDVDGLPNTRSCITVVRPGMRVATERSVRRRVDARRGLDRVGRFFPVGFQYRWFKRQNVLWWVWERLLRRLAAETPVPESVDIQPAERIAADTVVVGAGPAGMSAALAAADCGLEVVLVGRRERLGGGAGLPFPRVGPRPEVAEMAAAAAGSQRIRVLAPATVVAAFGDVYLVDHGDRLTEVTARTSVLATGQYERPVLFPGNDRPGVMLTSAVRRLLADGGLTDATIVLVVADDSGYLAARELAAAGHPPHAVVDVRPGRARQRTSSDDQVTSMIAADRVLGLKGRRRIKALVVQEGPRRRMIPCDIVGMSGGWQQADELRYSATSVGDDIVLGQRATRIVTTGWEDSTLPSLQGVGAVVGTSLLSDAVAEGAVAGSWAGVQLGGTNEPIKAAVRTLEASRKSGEQHG